MRWAVAEVRNIRAKQHPEMVSAIPFIMNSRDLMEYQEDDGTWRDVKHA